MTPDDLIKRHDQQQEAAQAAMPRKLPPNPIFPASLIFPGIRRRRSSGFGTLPANSMGREYSGLIDFRQVLCVVAYRKIPENH